MRVSWNDRLESSKRIASLVVRVPKLARKERGKEHQLVEKRLEPRFSRHAAAWNGRFPHELRRADAPHSLAGLQLQLSFSTPFPSLS